MESRNRPKEVEEFEETRAGVKGLVDSCVVRIPRFFIQTSESCNKTPTFACNDGIQLQIPTIDLKGIENGGSHRKIVVDEILKASETWGFFQIMNHGIPTSVINGILEGTRRFHEQPKEAKMDLYSADGSRKVRFFTINGTFRETRVANWRDALAFNFPDDTMDLESIPLVCRDQVFEYVKHMIKLRDLLSELLSEALGLSSDYLARSECMKSEHLSCLYYPPCPEPDLTFGLFKHSDTTFLTIVAQDGSGGLQVFHEDHQFPGL